MSLRDSADTAAIRLRAEAAMEKYARDMWHADHPNTPVVFPRSDYVETAMMSPRSRAREPSYAELTDQRSRSISNPDFFSKDQRFEFKNLGQDKYMINQKGRSYENNLAGWPAVGEVLTIISNDAVALEWNVVVTKIFVRSTAGSGTVHLKFIGNSF